MEDMIVWLIMSMFSVTSAFGRILFALSLVKKYREPHSTLVLFDSTCNISRSPSHRHPSHNLQAVKLSWALAGVSDQLAELNSIFKLNCISALLVSSFLFSSLCQTIKLFSKFPTRNMQWASVQMATKLFGSSFKTEARSSKAIFGSFAWSMICALLKVFCDQFSNYILNLSSKHLGKPDTSYLRGLATFSLVRAVSA